MPLSLRRKLLLAIGALLVVQISTGTINILTVGTYRHNTLQAIEQTIPEIQQLDAIEVAGHQLLFEAAVTIQHDASAHSAHLEARAARLRQLLVAIEDIDEEEEADAAAVELQLFDTLKQQAEVLIATAIGSSSGDISIEQRIATLEAAQSQFDQAITQAKQETAGKRAAISTLAERNPVVLPTLLGLLGLVIAIGLLGLLSLRVLRPIERLRAATEAVAAGDLTQQVPDSGHDELGQLGRSFNTMLSYIRSQQQTLRERASELERANTIQRGLLETVQALSVPVIPVGEGVLALPLLGALDSERTAQVTTTLLNSIAAERTHTVILDVTGLAAVDTPTALRLLSLAQSVQLLGAQLILTGISASMAQQIVSLDIDLSQISVCGTLREGLALALGNGKGAKPLSRTPHAIGARF